MGPSANQITVRPARAEDLPEVLAIADAALGTGYFTVDDVAFDAVASDVVGSGDVVSTDRSFTLVAEEAAVSDGSDDSTSDESTSHSSTSGRVITGFAVGLLVAPAGLERLLQARPPAHLAGPEHAGVLKTVAVRPGSTGRGIASRLTHARLEEFRRRGVRTVFSVAWQRGDVVPARPHLERHGLRPFAEIPRFWTRDSLAEGSVCPVCGPPPCLCAAVLFGARLGTASLMTASSPN